VVELDARFDHALDLIRPFLQFLHDNQDAAGRVTEKFLGARKDDEVELFAKKIQRRRAQGRCGQPLLHRSEAPLIGSESEKLYIFVRVQVRPWIFLFESSCSGELPTTR